MISIGYWQVLWVLFDIYWLMAGTGGYWGYQESISIRYLVSLHWRVLADIKNIFHKMLGIFAPASTSGIV